MIVCGERICTVSRLLYRSVNALHPIAETRCISATLNHQKRETVKARTLSRYALIAFVVILVVGGWGGPRPLRPSRPLQKPHLQPPLRPPRPRPLRSRTCSDRCARRNCHLCGSNS